MESYEVDCRARDKRRVAPCSREEKQERGCIKAAISSSGVIADKSGKDSEKGRDEQSDRNSSLEEGILLSKVEFRIDPKTGACCVYKG